MAQPVSRRRQRLRRLALIVGAVAALVAVALLHARLVFLRDAQRHAGEVVDMHASTGAEPTFAPVVRYTDALGTHDIVGRWHTDPPRFELGERVGVWAKPGEPGGAVFDSVFSLWGWTAAWAALAASALGFWIRQWVRDRLAARLGEWLRRDGLVVQARLLRVEAGNPFVDGPQARHIVAVWTDPETGRRHEFRSAPIDFDPTPWARPEGGITVFFDPRDPRRHVFDLAFLPGGSRERRRG